MHGAIINSNVSIGKNCIINTGSIIEHDTLIGDHSHISTGCIVNGSCNIGPRCFIGSNTVVSHSVKIPENTIIWLGSNVPKTIFESGVYMGNPARLRQ